MMETAYQMCMCVYSHSMSERSEKSFVNGGFGVERWAAYNVVRPWFLNFMATCNNNSTELFEVQSSYLHCPFGMAYIHVHARECKMTLLDDVINTSQCQDSGPFLVY